MKQAAVIFLAVLFATVIALFGYDHFVVVPREKANAEQIAAAAKVDLASARAQANQISEDLDKSVRKTVTDAQAAFDGQTKESERRRLIGMALTLMSAPKTAISEFYANSLSYPKTLAEAGFGDDIASNEAVRALKLEANGVIVAQLRPVLGENAELRLIPKASNYGTQWSCVGTGVANLHSMVPVCTER